VLAVDPERERISLGIKQLDTDPFSTYVATHNKGSIVKGVVTEVDARGATIELADTVMGYLRASEIARERVEDASAVLKVGDEVEAKFVAIDRKSRSINLSIKAKDYDEEAEVIRSYSSKSQQPAGGAATLGDLLKEQMESGDND
jgi:small subunit ribosomal protein S1